MSTNGLSMRLVPLRPLVSYSGSAEAPGSRGPIQPASRAMQTALATAAGTANGAGRRRADNTVVRVRSCRARSAITVTTPAAISTIDETICIRPLPSAAMNTNSTPPGTSASPRASARNANASAITITSTSASPASGAQPAPYSTGAMAVGNCSRTRSRSAVTCSHVSDQGIQRDNVSR